MQETIKENAQLAMQAYDAWEDQDKNHKNSKILTKKK